MEAIEIQTGSKAAASVIWLHGLGADGHDFEPIVPELEAHRLGEFELGHDRLEVVAELELTKPVRFVFPHAPIRPVTINNGMRMRAWYDIYQLGSTSGVVREDDAGLRAS